MLKNLKLATKLFGSFIVVLALMAGLGFFALSRLSVVNDSAVELASDWMPSVRAALTMQADLNRLRVIEFKSVMASGAAEVAAADQEGSEKIADLQKQVAEFAKLM